MLGWKQKREWGGRAERRSKWRKKLRQRPRESSSIRGGGRKRDAHGKDTKVLEKRQTSAQGKDKNRMVKSIIVRIRAHKYGKIKSQCKIRNLLSFEIWAVLTQTTSTHWHAEKKATHTLASREGGQAYTGKQRCRPNRSKNLQSRRNRNILNMHT